MRLMFRATHASRGGIIIGDVGSWTGIDVPKKLTFC